MDVEKLIDRLRTEGLYKDKATLEIMDLCMEAAEALTTPQIGLKAMRGAANSYKAENAKPQAELEKVKAERGAYKIYFDDLSSKPDCNTCDDKDCRYRPRVGAIVRVNCPFWCEKEE